MQELYTIRAVTALLQGGGGGGGGEGEEGVKAEVQAEYSAEEWGGEDLRLV